MPDELIDYIFEICEKTGPRITGSQGEAKTSEYLKEKLEPLSDEMAVDEFFKCRPYALQGLIIFEFVGILLGFILYFVHPFLATTVIVSTFIIAFLTRMRGMGVIDILLKSRISGNVIAIIKPNGTPKRRVIFSGHHDSAFYMPLFAKHKDRLSVIQNIPVITAIIFAVIASLKTFWYNLDMIPLFGTIRTSIARLVHIDLTPFYLPIEIFTVIIGLISVVSISYFTFNMVTRRPILGANDNLSALAVILGIAQKVSKDPPENTEVWLVSFGAEEPAMLGSKAFSKGTKESQMAHTWLIWKQLVKAGLE
ncbi:MAG: M28 family peptidase [Halobacteriota archaeon]|nr:M28 family peptidase [Halobacteriota archaeon]